jgi:hypothetical protein
MKLNMKTLEDKLKNYFKSKGFTFAKAEQVGQECVKRLQQLAAGGGDFPDDANLRSMIHDVLTKSTAPSSGSNEPAGAASTDSLADDAAGIVKDVAKHL